eukprot:COSAG02_NODE_10066_length_2035_cov_1.199380_1_plen_111_part_00
MKGVEQSVSIVCVTLCLSTTLFINVDIFSLTDYLFPLNDLSVSVSATVLQTVCDAKCALEFLPFMAQCGRVVSIQNSGSQIAAFDKLEITCEGLAQDEVLTAIGAAQCPR